MRELEFDDCVSLQAGRPSIENPLRFRECLMAFVAWPEDADSREAYLTAHKAKALACDLSTMEDCHSKLLSNPKTAGEDLQPPVAEELRKIRNRMIAERFHDSREFGVLAAASLKDAALSDDFLAQFAKARLAGQRLSMTASMSVHHEHQLRGGASLSKATSLLAHHRGLRGEAQTTNSIMAAWASHKHIAHLAAAVELVDVFAQTIFGLPVQRNSPQPWQDSIEAGDKFCEDIKCNLRTIMSVAQELLDFGLGFEPKHAPKGQYALDKSKAYKCPFRSRRIDISKLLLRLTADDLSFLEGHFTDPAKNSPASAKV